MNDARVPEELPEGFPEDVAKAVEDAIERGEARDAEPEEIVAEARAVLNDYCARD